MATAPKLYQKLLEKGIERLGRLKGFRLRLALMLIVTLTAIQILTGFFVYQTTRQELISQGERQLSAASVAFVKQLDDLSERVAENVRVMALDFGIRTSIAQHDAGTILSVLRNHGRRIKADRMMLIDLDGMIEVDTGTETGKSPFPYPDLLDQASEGKASAIVPYGPQAVWLVVVPVLAPTPIAYVAAQIPLDGKLLKELAEISGLGESAELITLVPDKGWKVLPNTQKPQSIAAELLERSSFDPNHTTMVHVDGLHYVALISALEQSDAKSPVMAVLSYNIDTAMKAYYGVFAAWSALSLVGLLGVLVAALVIAKMVSRPIEDLATAANRIAEGDYWEFKVVPSNDEIGDFAVAFAHMIETLRDREGRLKDSERDLEAKVESRTHQLQMEQTHTAELLQKNEELLHNILPTEIAKELAATGKTRSVRHDAVTILFTDFAGFTQLASSMPADRMVAELNDIFAAFDHITDECGVEKIKTIGDAYMAVAGVPTPCADHAFRCVEAGLRMKAYIAERNLRSPFKWGLRVGIHTGPVIAGVVGTRKYAFDIWGDTVNIASRMESSGEVDQVNISAYTFDQIQNDYVCRYRGKVSAKGKGEMDMYFVEGKKNSAANSQQAVNDAV